MIKVFGYKKCSTVAKAIKFLKEYDEIEFFDFVQDNIDIDVLKGLVAKSNEDINVFFNKNGVVFKEMKLKDQLDTLDIAEKLKLLASDGKLIKRPIIEINDKVLVGFNEKKLLEVLKG